MLKKSKSLWAAKVCAIYLFEYTNARDEIKLKSNKLKVKVAIIWISLKVIVVKDKFHDKEQFQLRRCENFLSLHFSKETMHPEETRNGWKCLTNRKAQLKWKGINFPWNFRIKPYGSSKRKYSRAHYVLSQMEKEKAGGVKELIACQQLCCHTIELR